MRVLYINNNRVDIDEQTSIGIDIQCYDIKDPGNRKINVSNNFTLPKTAQNLNIFGFASNVHSLSNNIYNALVTNYYIDNIQLIKDGQLRVTSISDRIECVCVNKKSIWDIFKLTNFSTIEDALLQYVLTKYSLPSLSNRYVGSFSDFIEFFINKTEGLHLPLFASNLTRATYKATGMVGEPEFAVETNNFQPLNFFYSVGTTSTDWGDWTYTKNGKFCIYIKDFFDFLQDYYDIEFYVNTDIQYNIWDDIYAKSIYIRLPNANAGGFGDGDGYYVFTDTTAPFAPLNITRAFEDLKVYDIVNGFFQLFGIIPVEVEENKIRLSRFDDIYNMYPKDISGNLSIKSFKPEIEGYAQENYIKFNSVSKELPELFEAKKIDCINKNIPDKAIIADINAFCPTSKLINQEGWENDSYLDLSDEESFKKPVFMINSGVTPSGFLIYYGMVHDTDYHIHTSDACYKSNINKAAIYSPSGEYNLLALMANAPRVFEIEKWLKLNEIENLDLFNQFYFKELGASFFINKIKGFNPQNSQEPTTLEIIQCSNKTPIPSYITDWFVDGVDEAFTDSEGNYFY